MPPIKITPLKKPAQQAQDTTKHLVKKQPTDPKFKTEKEHGDYYRAKALPKLSADDKKLYDSMKTHGSQADADAIIALRGGTPPHEKEAYKSAPKKRVVYSTSGLPSSGKAKSEPAGYRYKANKPAVGSVTIKKKVN